MKKILLSLFATASILGLSACGGGGGGGGGSSTSSSASTEITGQAAAGAAMSYAEIYIRGYPLAQEQQFIAYADVLGNFKVPAGVSLPALVIATSANGKQTFYGYIKSSAQKTVAVNPITTTLLGLASQAKGVDLYSMAQALPDSALATAQSQTAIIFGELLDAMKIGRDTDFLGTTFSTDHTGLDLILDYISAYVDRAPSGAVHLTNKLDGGIYTATSTSITPISFGASSQSVANTLTSINALGKCSNFILGLGDVIATDISAYSSDFLDSGLTKTVYKNRMSQLIATTPIVFTSPIFLGLDGNSNYIFATNIHRKNNSKDFISDINLFTKIDSQGNCKLVGNQYPFEISIQPAIKHHSRFGPYSSTNTTSGPVAGIEVQVGAWQNLGDTNTYAGTQVAKASVQVCNTSSLCTPIASLTSSGLTGTFDLDDRTYAFMNMIPNPSISLVNGNPNPIKVIFYDSSNNQIGSPIYMKIAGDKFSSSELSGIVMPQITNASALLTTNTTNPSVSYSAGSTVVSSLKLYSGTNNIEHAILSSSSGSHAFTGFTLNTADSYRSMYLAAHLAGRPGMISLKYFYSTSQNAY